MNEKENNANENNSEIERYAENKKGKIKFLLSGILIVIAIAIGLYIGYKKLNNNPIGIYKDTINGVYKVLNKALIEGKEKSLDNIDIMNEPINISIDTKLTSSISELKDFSNLNYHIEAGIDYQNKKMNLGLGIKDNTNSIISIIMSVINKNLYLKSEELYNKVIDLGEEEIFENMNFDSYFKVNGNNAKFDYDNYRYILKEFKTIIIDSLAKNKFKIAKETITINEKKYKSKKVTYNLDKENMERTIDFIKTRILKNEKLLNSIASCMGITAEELKEALNEEITMDGYSDLKINLYTDKLNNLIAGSFLVENIETIRFDCINDEVNFELKDEDNILKVLKESNGHIVVTYSENSSKLFKIAFESYDKEIKMPYIFVIDGDTTSGTIEFKNIEKDSNSISSDFYFSLNSAIANEKIDLILEGTYKLSKTDVNALDPTGSININDISEEDAMQIFNKLSTILERFNLNNLIGAFL